MHRTRARLALVAACALLVVGVVAVALPDGGDPGSPVSAGGPDRSTRGTSSTTQADETTSTAVTAPADGADEVVTSGAPRSTGRPARTSATTAPQDPSAPTTPTTEANVKGPGPATLANRLVYFQEDSWVDYSLWSARLDGSGKRKEVGCPAPEVPPPSPLPKDYWLDPGAFDLSPDGTHLVRSCLVKAPAETGRMDLPGPVMALVVQDVDGAGYRELWRYEVVGHAIYPTWSPQGDRILVWTVSALISIRPDGTDKKTIVRFPPTTAQRLTFSPDGSKVVTDTLDVLDLATGKWSKPTDAGHPWPYDGGWSAYGVLGWRAEGIWFMTEWISVMGPDPGPQSRGLYHLDPATGWVKQASRWDEIVSRGHLVGDDVYGWSVMGGKLIRVTPDGVAHPIPITDPVGLAISPL